MVDLIDVVDVGAIDADLASPAPSRLSRLARIHPRNWRPREWRRYAPLLLVAFAVGFAAWMLRAELHAVPYPNDASTHASFSRFAEQRIRSGHSPFDAWYPYLGLGSPQFLQYQTLSHILTGLLSIVFGDSTFRWANYLLICTWPATVYVGARLLGLDRWQAGAAALFSPMLVNVVGYGFEWASFVWLGSGMWSMLWALWLMPVALGLAWRAVAKGERYALAAFVVGLTCALHFITGYLVLLSIGVFVLMRPLQLLRRIGRSALVGVGALLTFAFVFVPTLGNLKYVSANSFQVGSFWDDSYGPGKVFSWLVHGRLFDSGRHPVVSLLVALGALICLVRSARNEAARVPLGLMVLSLLLYSGRGVVGFVINHVPGGSDILLHRFIIGVHFAGMLLAGIAAVWVFRVVFGLARFVLRVPGRNVIAVLVACILAGLAMWPVLVERKHYADRNTYFIEGQLVADSTTGRDINALLDIAKQRGGGRVYAGLPNNWGSSTKLDQVSMFEFPLQRDADSYGFTLRTNSLSADLETLFAEDQPAWYDLFNVRYILVPTLRPPALQVCAPGVQPPCATKVEDLNGFSLWEVGTSGYLEVVDATEPIVADRKNMLKDVGGYLSWPAVSQFRHPLIAFDGKATPPPSMHMVAPYSGPPGSIDSSAVSLDNGRFEGRVQASRPAWVMLKESYAPHWRATVDGQPVPTAMLAPSFVGVPIPAGSHEVVFQYHSQSGYPALFALGALTLLALGFGPAMWRRYRQRDRSNDPGDGTEDAIETEPVSSA